MQSPSMSYSEAVEILNGRKGAQMGSKWGGKTIGNRGMPIVRLRVAVAMARCVEHRTYRDIGEAYGVSDGFIRKWSRVYEAGRTVKAAKGRAWNGIRSVFKSVSNRPRHVESPVRDAIRDEVVSRRGKYPFEGAPRIKAAIGTRASTRTVNKVLRESGLLDAPKKRHANLYHGRYERPLSNQMWHTDFKEWNFGGLVLKSCWLVDDRSRFITGFRIGTGSSADVVIRMCESAAARFGTPDEIMTDHGTEFYSVRGGKGRSEFDAWCKKNGVAHVMSRVRHPQTNGKMERTHLSAVRETPAFGEVHSPADAVEVFGRWVDYHNNSPHSALGYRTPAEVYMAESVLHDYIAGLRGPPRARKQGPVQLPLYLRPCFRLIVRKDYLSFDRCRSNHSRSLYFAQFFDVLEFVYEIPLPVQEH